MRDQFAGAGIRFNTMFIHSGKRQLGHPFAEDGPAMLVYDNILIRTGSYGLGGDYCGAFELEARDGNVENIIFENNRVSQTHHAGIAIRRKESSTQLISELKSVHFFNTTFEHTPVDITVSGNPIGEVVFLSPSSEPELSVKLNNSELAIIEKTQ